MAYDNTIDVTYKFDAVGVSSGATLKCAPPAGKTRGIIRTVIAYGTGTQVTGSALAAYTVGNSVTTTRYVDGTFTSHNSNLNLLQSPDRRVLTEASSDVVVDLENDEVSVVTDVEVVVNNLATAGSVDFVVVIGWF